MIIMGVGIYCGNAYLLTTPASHSGCPSPFPPSLSLTYSLPPSCNLLYPDTTQGTPPHHPVANSLTLSKEALTVPPCSNYSLAINEHASIGYYPKVLKLAYTIYL